MRLSTVLIAGLCVAAPCLAQEAKVKKEQKKAAPAPAPLTGLAANPMPEPIKHGKHRVALQLVGEGLNSPLHLTHDNGATNRLYLIDQPGGIFIIENGKLNPKPWADLSKRIVQLRPAFDERGLLGLAFHPDFNKQGSAGYRKFYTYTSEPLTERSDFPARDMEIAAGDTKVKVPVDHQSVIAEWTMKSDGSFDESSRREVMRIDEPQFNHDGGAIVFGHDGLLYIGVGDGGAGNDLGPGHTPIIGNAQDLTKPLGKILRIDPLGKSGSKSKNGQYSIPADNPFVNEAGAVAEIYAYGLRNPFRLSVTPDGQLIAGDVGQEHVEELDVIVKGGNYGWNFKEGVFYFSPTAPKAQNIQTEPYADRPKLSAKLIDPAAAYDHDEGISIMAGYTYRGQTLKDFAGLHIFGDWRQKPADPKDKTPNGRIFVTNLKGGPITEVAIEGREKLGENITGFGEDAQGEVYVLTNNAQGPIGTGGKVYKLTPAK